MKSKIIGMLAAIALGFSAQSFANYNVYIPVNQCTWSLTSSGTAGSSGATVYWYNESLSCTGVGSHVATKSWWTSTNGQSSCSINGVNPYKVNGTCNSFTIYYTVIVPPTGPAGAACTWSSSPTGSSGQGSTVVYFYSPIGQCQDTRKVVEYRNNVYYSTYYQR